MPRPHYTLGKVSPPQQETRMGVQQLYKRVGVVKLLHYFARVAGLSGNGGDCITRS